MSWFVRKGRKLRTADSEPRLVTLSGLDAPLPPATECADLQGAGFLSALPPGDESQFVRSRLLHMLQLLSSDSGNTDANQPWQVRTCFDS